MSEIFTLGIDVGSTASKCIILKDGKEIVGKSLIDVGAGTSGPNRAIEAVLEDAGLKKEDMAFTLATGYGRTSLMDGIADKQMSELSCHAKGAYFLFPKVHTVIDIGGQDVKVLRVEDGVMTNFQMNDKCAEWKKAENIDYSLYGTPLESTTYKFAKCLQRRFGIIEGITDKGYITNSYHVHVTEEINAFDKLKFEAQFQHLSPGGAISYVEVPDMQNNIPAVLEVMKFIYNNIIYAELNTKSDYCQVCGWDGEIQIVEDNGKLIWKCPKCGNTDQDKMNVARRTCGYIGTQFWNQGRTQEIRDRVLHL